MKLSSVEMLSPDFTEAISFNLLDAESDDRYKVRTIIGLDADEIISKFYGYGLESNSKMYEARLRPREIVMRLVLNPNFRLDESYSSVRDDLYKAISATRSGKITLHFKSGATVVAKIEGFISKFEVPHFVKLPEVQLTIQCDDPMFRGLNRVYQYMADISPQANPILVPDGLSTAPHGFIFTLTCVSATPSLTIQDVASSPDWQFVVTPPSNFLVGDSVRFSSEYLNKYLTWHHAIAGTDSGLLDRLSPASVWPVLFPGQNSFHIVNLETKWRFYSIEYYAAYWGV
jgi:hypothetical protein